MVAAAATTVLMVVVALAVAITIFLVALAAAGAGLGAHGALAGFLYFFRSGSAAKVNGHAQIMIDGVQEFVNGLARFQKAAGRIILDDVFTQGVRFEISSSVGGIPARCLLRSSSP